MIQTSIGLPNTCAKCGKPCTGQWWAENVDAAHAGDGRCEACVALRLEPTDQSGLSRTPPVVPSVTAPVKRRRKRGGA
jgi:hypothetical protein